MDFIPKPNVVVGTDSVIFKGPYSKPATCPWCGIGTDGSIHSGNQQKYDHGKTIYMLSIQCTHCAKYFIAVYLLDSSKNKLEFITIVPQPSGKKLHHGLDTMSSRFAEIHKQSETAELQGHFDLAAMGYRNALEVLIKDYAIKELKKPEGEVVKKSLSDAISEYLNQSGLVKSADVVRFLGNDYVHYLKAYPQHDFSVLKQYYDIFINLITAQYDANHPPAELERK